MDAVRCKHLHPTKRQSVNRLAECHSFVALGSCQHFVVPLSFATSVPCAFLSVRRFSGCSRFGGYIESHPFMRCASGIAHQKFSHMSNAQLHPSPKHVAVAVSKGSQGNLLGEASLLHPLFPTTSSSSSSSSSSIESMDGIDSADYAPYVCTASSPDSLRSRMSGSASIRADMFFSSLLCGVRSTLFILIRFFACVSDFSVSPAT